MYLTIKNVKLKEGTSYRVVSKSETLLGTDLIRSTTYSEDYYSSEAENRMNWHLLRDGLSGWIGKTVVDFEKFCGQPLHYEIIRVQV